MYNFDQKLDRHGYSTKWDEPLYPVPEEKEFLPLWIADMDFATPDCVLEAIRTRLSHPTFGYFNLDSRFYEAIISWAKSRRGVTDLKPEYIQYQNSTVGAIVAAVQVMTKPGDAVLVHLPNYTGFTYGIADAGRRLVGSPLAQDENGIFRMNLADMERKIVDEKICCMILCSPHNPTGRVWTQKELTAAAALCEKHSVKIISDEVWADFVFSPAKHLPTALVSSYARENTIATYGATKTFNLAGLRIAYSIVYGDELRKVYQKHASANHYNVPNVLSAEALIGAYTGGESYADELFAYIRGNMEYVDAYLKEHLPAMPSYLPEGTYTMWFPLPKNGLTDEQQMLRLANEGLIGNPASDYNGTGWIRLNLACPRSTVEKAVRALCQAMQ